MDFLRRTVGPIAATWLFCHLATLTVATVVWSGVGEQALECQCTHGDHAYCPMHHKPAPGSKLCLMGKAADDGTAILTLLFGAAGLMPSPTAAAVRPQAARALVLPEPTPRSLRPPPPDPPPPRA